MKKIFVAVSVLYATGAFAGEPVDSVRTFDLQNVLVTATRADQKTPMAVSDLNQNQIQKLNFGQDIPQLLSLTPSVIFTSDAGNGIGYTSMRVRGSDPSRINVTANGIPVNDAESSTVFWVNMGDFASSLQSLQIQRGVGTSTNGSGAFGATLNMQTEDIGAKPFIGLDMAGGSYASHKETLRFGTGLLGGHWGIQGRLSNIGSDGYLERASTDLNSYFIQAGYFSDNTMVKFLTFNGTERTYHAWNYASKYEQNLYGRRYNSCGEYYDAEGNVHYYDGQTDNYHQQNYQLHLNQIIDDNWNFTAALHYTKGAGYYEEYKGSRTWGEYDLTTDWNILGDLVRQKKMANDFYGAVASLSYENKKGLSAHLGGGWNLYDGDHFGKVIWTGAPYIMVPDGNGKDIAEYIQTPADLQPNHTYYDNNTKKTDGNIFGKMNYDITDKLGAYLDLQYRHVGIKMNGPTDVIDWNTMKRMSYNFKKSYDFFNPKFGLNYDITSQHRLYVSYAIAHKEPVRNNFENNLNAGLEQPRAERLNDLELGYQYTGRFFSAGANIYYMDYKDQFVLTGEIDKIGEPITRNLPTSYRLGVELQAAWKPVDWFRWDANATLSRNRVKDVAVQVSNNETAVIKGDSPLAFSPDMILNNIFTFKYRNLDASIQTQYVSEQFMTNTGIRSYSTVGDEGEPVDVSMMLGDIFNTNFNIAYHFDLPSLGVRKLTVGCTVYNLFSAKFDNNGWAAPNFKADANGKVTAYTKPGDGQYMAGFAPSAPINFMARVSMNF